MEQQCWTRRELLPGLTTKQWARAGLWSIGVSCIGGIGAVVWALVVLTRTQAWDPAAVAFIVTVIGGMGFGWVCSLMSDRKERAELAAGYTTSAQGNNKVVRWHSPTGVVMREAGEPNLTKPQWEAAMARVRAYEAFVAREKSCTEGDAA
ncbi:hypothetical protein [uncultured Leifsonia sp.]|uniref:hypothetical protein n=1 Tax=uncultured Leifsonia sp. TaxID=340359 RepID=UPI0026005D24|nr:hypothetical protein [uncultured Leifsonia sp.]